jgi:hypothetical protein
MRLPTISSIVLALTAAAPAQDASSDPKAAAPHWFKGNLHTHTPWSDGNDYPEMVVDWYAQRGIHITGSGLNHRGKRAGHDPRTRSA